jgi:hypothetical protein
MEATQKIVGEEHPDTLRNMHDLAMTYRDRGQRKEMEELHDQALKLQVPVLEVREKVLGLEHPDTWGA